MTTARPPEIARAVVLLWTSLLLGVVRLVFDWRDLTADGAAPVGLMVTIAILTIAVLAGFVHLIARGRNWARIVFTGLYLLGLVVSLPDVWSELGTAPIAALVGALQLVLQGVALVLLFRPAAAAWFRGTA